MKCRNAKKLVFDFIDGLDNDKERLELEKHLAQCTECDKLASQLTASMDLLHRAPQEKTSDNFAWKVRLKLNQERNSVRERSASYGELFRSWNLRYAATAVSAFAVVLAVGLFAVNSQLISTPSNDTVAVGPTIPETTPAAPAEAGDQEPIVVAEAETSLDELRPSSSRPGIRSPRLGFDFGGRRTTPRLTSQVSSSGVVSAPGPALIDAPAVMSITELDAIIGKQLEGLTREQKVRYLNHSLRIISLRLLEAQTGYQSNR